MGTQLPFSEGRYEGKGKWFDVTGDNGAYTIEAEIRVDKDGIVSHFVLRTFLKDDGGILYEEKSQTSFNLTAESFFDVTIKHGEDEFIGHGYIFGNLVHYEFDVAFDENHVENTCTVSPNKVQLIGSATNNGKFTAWVERINLVA
jgi:hypothetical protein